MLKDLKIEKPETDIDKSLTPAYPWGLSLCFDDTLIKKLNIDVNNLQINDEVSIIAVAKLTNISVHEEDKFRIEMQITKMESPKVKPKITAKSYFDSE